MSLVSLVPSPDLTAVQRVPRGFELLSDDINGDKCRFRTTQAVDLIPAKIIDVRYETDREVLSSCPFDTAQSALIISLSPLKKDGHLGAAGLKTLRFHLSGTWEQASLLLYAHSCKCGGHEPLQYTGHGRTGISIKRSHSTGRLRR